MTGRQDFPYSSLNFRNSGGVRTQFPIRDSLSLMKMRHSGSTYNSTRQREPLRQRKLDKRCSQQVTYLPPIREEEPAENNEASSAKYRGAITLCRRLDSESVLPYDCSETRRRYLRKHMHHYTTTIISSAICTGPKRRLLPATLKDELLFHALILASATHASWYNGSPPPREVYHHRALAIRLMNEKLNAKRIEPSAYDSMINTIYFFLITESYYGTPESLKIHWTGLVQLVRMAGGLDNLGLGGVTRRNALWADLITAMALKEKPQLHPPYSGFQLFDYFGIPTPGTSCLATAFGAHVHVYTGSQDLSQHASTAFWALRGITEYQKIRKIEAFVDTAGPDEIQYSDRTEMLERVLVPLWAVKNRDCNHAEVLRMFAWATLIHIYACFRDIPIGMSLFGILADRIYEEVENCRDLEVVDKAFPDLMLWILFLAGKAAKAEMKSYFARVATKILAAHNVSEEKDVEAASQAFLWPVDEASKLGRTSQVTLSRKTLPPDVNPIS